MSNLRPEDMRDVMLSTVSTVLAAIKETALREDILEGGWGKKHPGGPLTSYDADGVQYVIGGGWVGVSVEMDGRMYNFDFEAHDIDDSEESDEDLPENPSEEYTDRFLVEAVTAMVGTLSHRLEKGYGQESVQYKILENIKQAFETLQGSLPSGEV